MTTMANPAEPRKSPEAEAEPEAEFKAESDPSLTPSHSHPTPPPLPISSTPRSSIHHSIDSLGGSHTPGSLSFSDHDHDHHQHLLHHLGISSNPNQHPPPTSRSGNLSAKQPLFSPGRSPPATATTFDGDHVLEKPPAPDACLLSPEHPGLGSAVLAAGLQPDDVYRSQMAPWRFRIRALLHAALEREMPVLEAIQRRCRSTWLDRVMVHSSWLGSHQFFILTLPLVFWLGEPAFGRAQVYMLAGAVYLTGVVKDLLCLPRPYAPPVSRLSISNHGSEYGFPSTHSATSASTILIGLQHALHVRSLLGRLGLAAGLAVYAFLLIFGRVYCGMHSLQDVSFGAAIGAFVWTAHHVLGSSLDGWIASGAPGPLGLPAPLVVVAVGLVLTAAHPQPVDDCPCFEDSTAFIAVAVGITLGHWAAGPTAAVVPVGLPQAGAKLVLGLLIIFGWRFAMKELLSRLLPPLFRLCAPLVELPRRHYAPTRDYGRYRDELREHRRRAGLQARLIPSVVHLPSPSTLRHRLGPTSDQPVDLTDALHPALRNRGPLGDLVDPLLKTEKLASDQAFSTGELKPQLASKRYDVDVLMRLIVYAGIGLLASWLLPALFNLIGFNKSSSPSSFFS